MKYLVIFAALVLVAHAGIVLDKREENSTSPYEGDEAPENPEILGEIVKEDDEALEGELSEENEQDEELVSETPEEEGGDQKEETGLDEANENGDDKEKEGEEEKEDENTTPYEGDEAPENPEDLNEIVKEDDEALEDELTEENGQEEELVSETEKEEGADEKEETELDEADEEGDEEEGEESGGEVVPSDQIDADEYLEEDEKLKPHSKITTLVSDGCETLVKWVQKKIRGNKRKRSLADEEFHKFAKRGWFGDSLNWVRRKLKENAIKVKQVIGGLFHCGSKRVCDALDCPEKVKDSFHTLTPHVGRR